MKMKNYPLVINMDACVNCLAGKEERRTRVIRSFFLFYLISFFFFILFSLDSFYRDFSRGKASGKHHFRRFSKTHLHNVDRLAWKIKLILFKY